MFLVDQFDKKKYNTHNGGGCFEFVGNRKEIGESCPSRGCKEERGGI